MQALYDSLAARGFRIAAVSIDEGSPEDVVAFAQKLGLTFDILHDRSGDDRSSLYQTTGVPESFLLDRRRHPGEAGHRRPRLELTREPQHRGATPGPARELAWPAGSSVSRHPATRPPRRCSGADGGVGSIGGPRDPLAGRAPRLRRSGPRAGEPGARPHRRLGGGPRARRRGDRPRPGGRGRRDRRSRPRRRPPRRRHLRQDARLQPRSPAAGRESPRRASLRPDARRPRPRAAVRGPAGERRAHHAARRARLGRVPAAGADARRRRRRGVRQGGQAAGARLSRRCR